MYAAGTIFRDSALFKAISCRNENTTCRIMRRITIEAKWNTWRSIYKKIIKYREIENSWFARFEKPCEDKRVLSRTSLELAPLSHLRMVHPALAGYHHRLLHRLRRHRSRYYHHPTITATVGVVYAARCAWKRKGLWWGEGGEGDARIARWGRRRRDEITGSVAVRLSRDVLAVSTDVRRFRLLAPDSSSFRYVLRSGEGESHCLVAI